MRLLLYISLLVPVFCSLGDNLPEFQNCKNHCDNYQCSGKKLLSFSSKYKEDDFKINSVSFPFKQLFGWDCLSDCDYKCQQIITNIRASHEDPIVKFYGKWPFKRILGVTELASVVFSLLNLWINYHNFKKIVTQERRNSGPVKVMYKQYLGLLMVSMIGWIFSTIFHIRDFPLTETLDYFGASLMIIFNCYVITVRYFELFKKNLLPYQIAFATVYVLHVIKLHNKWDYSYNILFHSLIGLGSFVLWIIHAISVNKKYARNYSILSNSIQLLPFETKILIKLNYLSMSKSKYIPLIPIMLVFWLMWSMIFEIYEFSPIIKLIDSHSVWHLMTFFPQVIWYDWNIWDLEVYKKLRETQQTV